MVNIVTELRERAGLTQEQLAEAAGVGQPEISKIESGDRKMTWERAVKLAPHMGAEPTDIMPLPGSPADTKRSVPRFSPTPNDLIPIRAAARGGNDQQMFLGDGLGTARRPGNLFGVKDAYAVYMVGESMEPRFRAGETLHVNPHVPVRAGCEVVVVKRDNSVLVKLFVSRNDSVVRLKQLNPAAALDVDAREVVSVHVVVGAAYS